MTQTTFEEAAQSIVNGDADSAVAIAKQGLKLGIDPLRLINEGFVPGINEVGDQFGVGRLFIPQLMLAARAMERATEIINTAFPEQDEFAQGKIVIATVEGDVHDIGKTIVATLFKANGFDVIDLGRDVPTARIIEAAETNDADIIGTSTLLTTTMTVQKDLEETLKEAGLRDKYKTIVGGAPVTKRWADRIGADAYANDAVDGVRIAKELMKGR
jgi:trimethylamine corrinoid protein